MKILFVSLFLPLEKSYHAGGRYVFEVIKNLSERHDINLVTRCEEAELPVIESLRPYCREVYPYTYRTKAKRGVTDNLRLVLNYIGFSRYADRLARQGRFDLVQVEWVEAALMMKKRNTPMVLDAHDVITKPAERAAKKSGGIGVPAAWLKYAAVKAFERRIVKKFDTVLTLSEYDRQYLLRMEPGLRTRTVPIPAGMDIGDRQFEREKNTILFLASYRYRRVNVDAALYFYRSVFPLVRKSIPGAVFIAAGYGPPEALKSLQENDPGVVVPGFVEDIEECYRKAAVFAAPILVGGGIIVKILDAMAAGTPVVTTSYGNEGIGAVPGRDLLVADDGDSFAASVVRVLADPEFAAELAANGRAFVRKNFSLDGVLKKRETVYEELVGARMAQPGL